MSSRKGATKRGSAFKTHSAGVPKALSARSEAANRIGKGTKPKKNKSSADDPPALSPWVLGIMVFVVIGSAIVGILSNAMNKSGP